MKVTEENFHKMEYADSKPPSSYNWEAKYWIYLIKASSLGYIVVMFNNSDNLKKMGLVSDWYIPNARVVEDTSDYVSFLEGRLKAFRKKLEEQPDNNILKRVEFIEEVLRELRSYDI